MRYETEKIKKRKTKHWSYDYRKNQIKSNVKKTRNQMRQKNELLDREFPKG